MYQNCIMIEIQPFKGLTTQMNYLLIITIHDDELVSFVLIQIIARWLNSEIKTSWCVYLLKNIHIFAYKWHIY